MSNITTFLNVRPFDESAINNKVQINPSPAHDMPIKVRDYLHETYSPMINRIAETLGSYATIWNSEINHCETKTPEKYLTNRLPPAVHL